MNYDLLLSGCKRAATSALCRAITDNPKVNMDGIAAALDALNEAWDRLTDALVRQRDERDRIIRDLINQLAEEKKKK